MTNKIPYHPDGEPPPTPTEALTDAAKIAYKFLYADLGGIGYVLQALEEALEDVGVDIAKLNAECEQQSQTVSKGGAQ